LECVLIHDIDAMKSSAGLSMAVGSFRDPTTAQGLAHYLEHMLFMGTAKYPDENDYSNVYILIFSSLLKMVVVTMLTLHKNKLTIC
jgi:secreted Zn-dependent insulinase-like peptidase